MSEPNPLAPLVTPPTLPTAPVIIGDNTILWGTGGLYSGGGIVLSATLTGNAEAQEVADTQGMAAAVVYFNQKQDIEAECEVEGATPPSFNVGDSVNICGVSGCYVQPGGFQLMYAQKGVVKFRLKVTKFAKF
jgi:hypothetical protein